MFLVLGKLQIPLSLLFFGNGGVAWADLPREHGINMVNKHLKAGADFTMSQFLLVHASTVLGITLPGLDS